MLLFTFVYEDDSQVGRDNKIEIDEDLFKRIARDDMAALDELYSISERTMYAFALSLTKDHQRSLDLMQDTYVKIISAAHLYKPMESPWLDVHNRQEPPLFQYKEGEEEHPGGRRSRTINGFPI